MDVDAGESGRVRALRARLGLSQEQLAQQLGVSFVTVNRWESGRTGVSPRALKRLAALENAREPDPGAPPAPPSAFIGREAEVGALLGLLTTSRLISLVGPGGAGKTRLALELVGRVRAPGLRVVFVALDSLGDPSLVESRVAAALGLRDRAGSPAAEAVVRTLAEGPALLVLDGAERAVVPPPGSGGVTGLAERVLAGSGQTRILITSRRLTGAAGEQVWPVPALTDADAVALFATRARERVPGFEITGDLAEATGELCRRLDGLPLAIELAAAWVGTLSVEQILRRRFALLGPPDGARTLHKVAESSHGLLSPAEQAVLAQLSVFAGPFTIDDAQAVTDIAAEQLVFALRGLVDSSWLVARRDGDRQVYRMLDTLREYAAGRLGAGAPPVRERHARHFAQMAAQSETLLAGAERPAWVSRLELASPDLDAALDWAAAAGGGGVLLGLRMSTALWRWWLTTGRLSEGRRRLSWFLAATEGAAAAEATQGAGTPAGVEAALAEAEGRRAEAVLAAENGDYTDAVDQAGRALRTFDEVGGVTSARSAAQAATVLGAAHRYFGDQRAEARYFELAAERWRQAGDEKGIAAALNNLALVVLDAGDLARAQRLLEEVLAIKRRLGDPRSVALGLLNLGAVYVDAGQAARAAATLAEAAGTAANLGDRALDGLIACTRGDLARSRRDFAVAASHYRVALSNSRTAGAVRDVVVALRGLGLSMFRLGDQEEALRLLREGEAMAVKAGDAPRLEEIRAALEEVGRPAAGRPPDGLTARQAEILAYVSAGLTNKDIAARLHLSVGTVERHLATCYRKLGLRNRAEATRYALRSGLSMPDT
ncbi:MAG: helix-turn-helix domain-containing protein [Streptosporangiaceae bacterium]|nr:helix-turn-helix domain-containing protein [Streptosporangiaceae bacterium]MBV9854429.1 helix-turn-helix domain-containing protein [Streptosporangiaceae bacterium]